MTVKRTASTAAAAVGIGMSALLMVPGPASAVPLAPPSCDQANQAACQSGPGGAGNGGGRQNSAPQAPSSAPQSPGGDAPQSSTPQAPQGNGQGGQNNAPQIPQNNAPQKPRGDGQGGQDNPPQGPQNNGSDNRQGDGSDNRQGDGSDNRQGDGSNHQPYIPAGRFDRGNDQVGGPRDAPHGFSTPDNGGPPPPPERGPGWNDGPAPGGPPPNWDGPPPAGGWDGAPPPGGWNRHYDGPSRDITQARVDFGPFNYDGYAATPVFNPVAGGWGFWFFGVWIPLF
jgi:hypothetical protein